MEKDEVSLIREFSHLGRYQQAHTINYELRQGEQGLVASLTRTQQGVQETQKIALVNWKPDEARLLVRFLYENAIPLENWQDVVADMTVSLTPRME